MGRYRAVTTEVLPPSLEVYAAQLQEYANAQDDGHAFFGEAVYPEQQRMDRAPMFYPINVDPPDPSTAVRIPQQSEFAVPQPDTATETALSKKPLASYIGSGSNNKVEIHLPIPAHVLQHYQQQHAAQQAALLAKQRAAQAKAREKQENIEKRARLRRHAAVRGSQVTGEIIREMAGDGISSAGGGEMGSRDLDAEELAIVEMYKKDEMSWGEIAALEELRGLRVGPEGMRHLYNRAKQRQAQEEQAQMMYRAGLAQAPGAVPGFYNPAMAAAAALGMRPGLPQPGAMLHVPPPGAATATLSGDGSCSGGRSRSPGWEPGSNKRASAGPPRGNKRPVGRPRKVATLPPLPEPYGGWEQFINRQAYHRGGGDARVQLLRPTRDPPPGFTGHMVHQLENLAGVTFYEEVRVADPEEPGKVYRFDLNTPQVCPCFHSGVVGPDGSPVLTWSQLHALYMLPDGTMWGEHSNFVDEEDLIKLGQQMGVPVDALLPVDEQELLRKAGRYHSQLQHIEYECLLVQGQYALDDVPQNDNTYYWERTFDPHTMQPLDVEEEEWGEDEEEEDYIQLE